MDSRVERLKKHRKVEYAGLMNLEMTVFSLRIQGQSIH